MTDPSLSDLLDGPVVIVTIGGRDYRFSEVPITALAEMQSWINREHPHPLEAVKPHLVGLDQADRQYLLEQARQESRDWPPKIGTAAGSMALMGSEQGQIEALYHGLQVHHPGTTRDDAHRIYRAMKRIARREILSSPDGESGMVKRIYAAIFGMLDDAEDGPSNGRPKGRAGATKVSPGISISGQPSNA